MLSDHTHNVVPCDVVAAATKTIFFKNLHTRLDLQYSFRDVPHQFPKSTWQMPEKVLVGAMVPKDTTLGVRTF